MKKEVSRETVSFQAQRGFEAKEDDQRSEQQRGDSKNQSFPLAQIGLAGIFAGLLFIGAPFHEQGICGISRAQGYDSKRRKSTAEKRPSQGHPDGIKQCLQ
jgi:hypothetical protein